MNIFIKEEFSFRRAAAEIGIAHTTIVRDREEKNIDLPTHSRIVKWLDVNFKNYFR